MSVERWIDKSLAVVSRTHTACTLKRRRGYDEFVNYRGYNHLGNIEELKNDLSARQLVD